MSILKGVSLFSSLSQSELDNLSLFCQERFLKNQEILFSEGDEATAMYIVKDGKLKAYKNRSEGETMLGYIDRDQFVGEMAFFDGDNIPKKRMATVKALEDTQLIVIMNYSIVDLASKRKDIYDKIADIIKERKYINAQK